MKGHGQGSRRAIMPVTEEHLALMVELLPSIASISDLCALTGLRDTSVRNAVAPFLAIMKLNGTHPVCACGELRFHPYGCKVTYAAQDRSAVGFPGRPREQWPAILEQRAGIVAMLIAGERIVDVAACFGVVRSCVEKKLRFLTPEQRALRDEILRANGHRCGPARGFSAKPTKTGGSTCAAA